MLCKAILRASMPSGHRSTGGWLAQSRRHCVTRVIIDEGIGQTGRIREFLGQGVERVYVPQRLFRCPKHPQRHGHITPDDHPEVETIVADQGPVVGWDIQGHTLREVSMRRDHLPAGKQHHAERRVCRQAGR